MHRRICLSESIDIAPKCLHPSDEDYNQPYAIAMVQTDVKLESSESMSMEK